MAKKKEVLPEIKTEDLVEDVVAKTDVVDLDKCEKAFSIIREKDGWYMNISYIKDGDIVKKDRTGPTMRAVVVDEFKMEAQRHFEKME